MRWRAKVWSQAVFVACLLYVHCQARLYSVLFGCAHGRLFVMRWLVLFICRTWVMLL